VDGGEEEASDAGEEKTWASESYCILAAFVSNVGGQLSFWCGKRNEVEQ
jgi:hypothetical protein